MCRSIGTIRRRRAALAAVLGLLAAVVSGGQSSGDDPAASPPEYRVTAFSLSYIRQSVAAPTIEQMAAVVVPLSIVNGAYAAPQPDQEVIAIPFADLGRTGVDRFRADALQAISQALVGELRRRSFISVFAAPDPEQIDEQGVDHRPDGETTLRYLVLVGVVTEVRTIASGDRVPEQERVNHPVHERIRRDSPIQPAGQSAADDRYDVIRKDLLDAYVHRLSRHPGRRVDVALGPSGEPGGVTLDYLISENRPLMLYAQVSNTGTSQTGYWRQRLGLVHHQVTNRDDILSFDYATAGFDDSHAASMSYEGPLTDRGDVRWRAYGSWSQYRASEIGLFDDRFRGETWSVGAEVAATIHQRRELFIDFVAGARFDEYHVRNDGFAIDALENFITPYVGVRLERVSETFATHASAMFEFQQEWFSSVDDDEIVGLGRVRPDGRWTVFQWNITHSFFLEPLLNRAAWEDPTTPESSTLAHEIVLAFRGQHSFNNRLIPQVQDVLGGLYTVRGYPESAVTGDSTVLASAEYRFHLPRALGLQPEPGRLFGQTFRFAPQTVYGRPDWDLVLKAFADVGWTDVNAPAAFERDEQLASIGLGVDLILGRNVQVRFDWGYVLSGLETARVEHGSNRAHLVVTFLF
ncbi:MAG: ShlB/FhaC/HecB family hemolysin secretion/activation protein [Phycisphaeraceae bacterium]|nr:hypothetical protein [Phycisphaerales bacterium]QOJ17710.1 MAG: ShlB/FhaC/HecB family hemolysin secretion/activation protein [Phycisphaeraceae bacterium]